MPHALKAAEAVHKMRWDMGTCHGPEPMTTSLSPDRDKPSYAPNRLDDNAIPPVKPLEIEQNGLRLHGPSNRMPYPPVANSAESNGTPGEEKTSSEVGMHQSTILQPPGQSGKTRDSLVTKELSPGCS